jgi:hypothetical protein
MNDPAQEKEPQDPGENELDDGDEEPALEELAQSGNEEAAKGRDHVAS